MKNEDNYMEPTEAIGSGYVKASGKKLNHPAFAKLTVSRISTSKPLEFFGSDSRHSHYVNIEISDAYKVEEGGSYNFEMKDKLIVSLSMTESQWAAFVASSARGDGVCATIEYGPKEGFELERKPYIKTRQTVHERFSDEIKTDIDRVMSEYLKIHETMKSLSANGKANKTQLMELEKRMEHSICRLPGLMSYITDRFAKTADDISNSAKVDFESMVMQSIVQRGLEQVKSDGLLSLGFVSPEKSFDSEGNLITSEPIDPA